MQQKNTRKIFGTDGIRGKANTYPMTVEVALALGRAIGKVFRQKPGKHRIVIGKDTRLSCYMFENALIAGLCSMGIDTYMLGPLPTPAVAFITRAYRADAGIVISASHNPYYDNGIKFFSADGFKLPESAELMMEECLAGAPDIFEIDLPQEREIGKNARINDADGRYIEFVKSTFERRMSLKGLRIALDCANGAGYRVAPLVFRELDAKVFVYGNTPDGLNINEGCGALYPGVIQRAVLDHAADVGIALDGDADRVIMVDEKGQIVDGDAILTICAKDMKQRGVLTNNRVVNTVMSNLGYIKALEAVGIEVIPSQVGDRYVIQKMLEHNAILGAEPSGHIIFLEHNTTGDGLVAALQVLRIMRSTGKKLSELTSDFQRYPQVSINLPVLAKPPLESIDGLAVLIKDIEHQMTDSGRVLVRYSGTEKILRIMVEGSDLWSVERFADEIAVFIKNKIGA